MKIGIVGCGLNSDYHINFARTYQGANIVGVVDRDREKAQECATRFNIKGVFSSIKDLVDKAGPEVVHILTPPRTHFAVAKEAMESGCHVLVEKPLGLNYEEAKELYDVAEREGVQLCTMHNHFYDPCMSKAHAFVQEGQLGQVINVESYYGLNTQISAFRDYPAPNVLPWLYNLPGGVYQDFMPHPLYVLLEYTGAPQEIKVMQQSHGVLPQGMADEIRILIKGEKAFGTLTFSFVARPHLHFVRIYGTKMMVEVDINTMTTIDHPLSSLPKAAQKATYNLFESWQLFKSTTANVINFIRGKLKPYQGMKILIHKYYEAIEKKTALPVTKEQALRVIKTMDEIWKQIEIKPLSFEPVVHQQYPYPLKHSEKILVTGGTGFLGKRLIGQLVAEGYPVRVLARKLSDIEPLKKMGVEIFYGDVADKTSLEQAFKGIDMAVHAAAGTSGNQKDCETATLQGTRNVIEMSEKFKLRKLVYVSSCSVYGVADYKTDQLVNEDSTLERFPERRGAYSASKQTAESFVIEAMKTGKLPVVILRPGTIYGPGGDLFSPMLGFSLFNKAFIVIGNGKFELPFVYIDNLVEAIIKTIQSENANNNIFNVVDSEKITKRDYMRQLIKKLYPGAWKFYFPYSLLYFIIWCQEVLFSALKRKPFLTRYRLVSSQRNIRYENSRIISKLNWNPKVSFNGAVSAIVDHEKNK
ncbi:MAG TPA: NAD-dependent epimerase/dehydratase family protein [Nitrospirota bacterium]|nr:NAD-dependent epimerase/dehydratase family protein [Nitrospirota bacterium]